MKATKYSLVVAVVLVGLMVPGVVWADSVNYTIIFTTTAGPAPTSGSFTYDTTSNTFSDFIVQWGGQSYDVTDSANNPGVSVPTGTGCTGEASTGAYGFQLMNEMLTGCTITSYQWSAYSSILMNFFEFTASDTTGVDVIGDPPAPIGVVEAYGTWTIEPTPEPATTQLLAAGLLGLLAVARFTSRLA